MTQAESQDLILKYLVDNPDRTFTSEHILEENILPEGTPIGTVELLIDRIANTVDEVAYVNIQAHGHFIRANNLTEVFLNQGGFTKYEKEEVEQKLAQEERDRIAFEKSKIDLELAKKWFARIGFIIGTVLALLKLAEYLEFLQPPN
jgi:hypothetical protein